VCLLFPVDKRKTKISSRRHWLLSPPLKPRIDLLGPACPHVPHALLAILATLHAALGTAWCSACDSRTGLCPLRSWRSTSLACMRRGSSHLSCPRSASRVVALHVALRRSTCWILCAWLRRTARFPVRGSL
jgi:hypothetical protein